MIRRHFINSVAGWLLLSNRLFARNPRGYGVGTVIPGQVATPTFLPIGGSYTTTRSVLLSSLTVGASIYYTTDGSVPTAFVTGTTHLYSSAISVAATETINAIGVKGGLITSALGSASYVIGAASTLPGWPFTVVNAIGQGQGADYKNPAWRQAQSRFNVIIFQGGNNTLEQSMNMTFDFVMSDMQARAAALPFPNPQCKTGFYVIDEEMYEQPYSSFPDTKTGLFTEATNKHWFVYSGGGPFPTGGHLIDSAYGAATLNMTDQTPVSNSGWSSGNNYANAASIYYNAGLITGQGATVNQSNYFAANTHCNFIIHDNQWNKPRAGTGQYLCTSATQSNGDLTAAAALQRGYKQVISKWRSLQPSIMQAGNCDWEGYTVNGGPYYDLACVGLYDYALWELMFGAFTYTSATFWGPSTLLPKMKRFEQLMSNNPNAIPYVGVDTGFYPGAAFPINQSNWGNILTSSQTVAGNNSSVVWSGNAWQGARMVLCFALLRGWGLQMANGTDNNTPYLDEYNKGGTSASNWIKTWLDTADTASVPWSNGVYRRRANEGIVYFNPVDNGNQTIFVTGHKLPNGGYSDGLVNNGQPFTQFTLKAGDGLITLP